MIIVSAIYAQDMLENLVIHVCVAGGIAAYKSVELVRLLTKAGARVRVAMTPNAQRFVGPLTFQAITQAPVLTDTMDPAEEMEIGHIRFAQDCDLILVVPATASCLGKAAAGIGDEVVSTVLLAANVPIMAAPAMNTFMYQNPAVQANIKTLRERGWTILEPGSGLLACGYDGPGRLPEPSDILARVQAALTPRHQSLTGRRVVVTAGPTREAIDGVRFLSNPSTGRMGVAVADALAAIGAEVVLIHGPITVQPSSVFKRVPVTTAAQMRTAVYDALAGSAAVVMTAAVADWYVQKPPTQKRLKDDGPWTLTLTRTADILAELGALPLEERPILVGFAAETGDPRKRGVEKRQSKNVDLIVANDVAEMGSGFGTETNRAHLIDESGVESLPLMSKVDLGHRIASWLAQCLVANDHQEGTK